MEVRLFAVLPDPMVPQRGELPGPSPVVPFLLSRNGVGNGDLDGVVRLLPRNSLPPPPEFHQQFGKDNEDAEHPEKDGSHDVRAAQQGGVRGRDKQGHQSFCGREEHQEIPTVLAHLINGGRGPILRFLLPPCAAGPGRRAGAPRFPAAFLVSGGRRTILWFIISPARAAADPLRQDRTFLAVVVLLFFPSSAFFTIRLQALGEGSRQHAGFANAIKALKHDDLSGKKTNEVSVADSSGKIAHHPSLPFLGINR